MGISRKNAIMLLPGRQADVFLNGEQNADADNRNQVLRHCGMVQYHMARHKENQDFQHRVLAGLAEHFQKLNPNQDIEYIPYKDKEGFFGKSVPPELEEGAAKGAAGDQDSGQDDNGHKKF